MNMKGVGSDFIQQIYQFVKRINNVRKYDCSRGKLNFTGIDFGILLLLLISESQMEIFNKQHSLCNMDL